MSGQTPAPLASPPRKPLGPLRLFFTIAGSLIMLVSGSCSIAIMPDALKSNGGGELHIDEYVVMVFGGVPFLVGLIIVLLAVKAGR
jgi:hypothetical protein